MELRNELRYTLLFTNFVAFKENMQQTIAILLLQNNESKLEFNAIKPHMKETTLAEFAKWAEQTRHKQGVVLVLVDDLLRTYAHATGKCICSKGQHVCDGAMIKLQKVGMVDDEWVKLHKIKAAIAECGSHQVYIPKETRDRVELNSTMYIERMIDHANCFKVQPMYQQQASAIEAVKNLGSSNCAITVCLIEGAQQACKVFEKHKEEAVIVSTSDATNNQTVADSIGSANRCFHWPIVQESIGATNRQWQLLQEPAATWHTQIANNFVAFLTAQAATKLLVCGHFPTSAFAALVNAMPSQIQHCYFVCNYVVPANTGAEGDPMHEICSQSNTGWFNLDDKIPSANNVEVMQTLLHNEITHSSAVHVYKDEDTFRKVSPLLYAKITKSPTSCVVHNTPPRKITLCKEIKPAHSAELACKKTKRPKLAESNLTKPRATPIPKQLVAYAPMIDGPLCICDCKKAITPVDLYKCAAQMTCTIDQDNPLIVVGKIANKRERIGPTARIVEV